MAMAGLVNEHLIARMKDHEDSFVEFKPESGDFKKTIVAFANSVPPGRDAVLYVGVGDDRKPLGVNNTDSLQKKIRKFCKEQCYPEIEFTTEILRIQDLSVLAIIVPYSPKKPHFAGPAWIRMGTESVRASESLFDDLITSRHAKAEELLKYKDKDVTVVSAKENPGRPEFRQIISGTDISKGPTSYTCQVETVTPFFARFRFASDGRHFSEPLGNIVISFDERQSRPLILITHDPT
jgi:hypothetical protein